MEFPKQFKRIVDDLNSQNSLVRDKAAADSLDLATADISRLSRSINTGRPLLDSQVGHAIDWLMKFIGTDIAPHVKETADRFNRVINPAVDRLMDMKNNLNLPEAVRLKAGFQLDEVTSLRRSLNQRRFRLKSNKEGQSPFQRTFVQSTRAELRLLLTYTISHKQN